VSRPARGVGLAIATLAFTAGCTTTDPGTPAAAPALPEPAPPAACLLDTTVLATTTGVGWTPDATTASDTRCVYDPDGGSGQEFVVIAVTADPGGLDGIAPVCASDTRTPGTSGGFVCGLPGGGVFAAVVRGEELVTIAAARVPASTTAERLGTAFAEQLDLLG